MRAVLGWSIPCGKIFGVELRLHSFFLLLLLLTLVWTSSNNQTPVRGLVLWLLLLLAVSLRETARALVAGWFNLPFRRVLLLPIGGLVTFANAEALARANGRNAQRALAFAGPVASVLVGLASAALVLTIAPAVDLTSLSWVSPAHLVRAFVWINLLLAAVNLLPAWPLDMGRLMQGELGRMRVAPAAETSAAGAGTAGVLPAALRGRIRSLRALASMGFAIAAALVVAGVIAQNMLLIVLGFGVMVGAQVERQGVLVESSADQVRVADVMLLEYSVVSASATLEDAVEQARHSLQDVFPVVRGSSMVGAVARQSVLEALDASGNGYVQGLMTREFQTAGPDESLVTALGRVTHTAGSSSQLVVVVEPAGDRVLGIITPQNLQRSMGLLARRSAAAGRTHPGEDTE